jgi:hypothetical protein
MIPCSEKDTLKRIEDKLDSIDNKLDNHLGRIAAAEVWIKGHTTVLAFIITSIITIVGFLLGAK